MSRLYGPPALTRVLGDSYSGPSISIEDGQWVLFVRTDAPSDIEILVRHPDWGNFLRLCGEYADIHVGKRERNGSR